ncbi:MAG: GntR family transcriptional regulator [Desulfobacteraceae bacterium]|nr:GntR family transcriptional regulator [Desulfobacteraceae bacterium]
MTQIKTHNLSEEIAQHIGEKIIQLEIKPGERILEAKIAEELGVSRSPVREAFRILERYRLVELIPRKGVKATEITEFYISCLYDILKVNFGLMASQAVKNADDEQRKKVKEMLQLIEAHARKGNVLEYYSGIFEFAAIGMAAARNPLLEQMLMDLWPSIRRIQFASLSIRSERLKENGDYFKKMILYLEENNPGMTEKIVREYAENEKQFAMSIIREGLL